MISLYPGYPAILEHPVRVGNQLYRARGGGTFERGERGRRGFRAVATGNEANSMDASDAARASLSTYPSLPRDAHHLRSFAVINERLGAARRGANNPLPPSPAPPARLTSSPDLPADA